MSSFILMFFVMVIISGFLSLMTSSPGFFSLIVFWIIFRTLMRPRRTIRHTYYYTNGNNDRERRTYQNRPNSQQSNPNNTQTNNQNNNQNTQESIGHNYRVDVRPPKSGSIDVEYTEELEEDLPE